MSEKTLDNFVRESFLKEQYKENPPKVVRLIIPHPAGDDFEKLNEFLMEKYHFMIERLESEEYGGDLFYNNDLRSYMGYMWDWDCQSVTVDIHPEHYKDGWEEEYWNPLIDDSVILGETR